jgi:hypothetical protein
MSGQLYVHVARAVDTWIAYLYQFFLQEFPVPTTTELAGRVGPEWAEVYGTELVRLVMDCTEYRIHQPSSRMAARTVWSDYKQAHTGKILAGIAPSGAYVWSSDAYPGRISDLEICRCSGFLGIIQRGDKVPSDKGFDGLSVDLQVLGASIKAPAWQWRGKPGYTATEREDNERQSNLRIHVERHFARVQNWGLFLKTKITLHRMDLLGKCFMIVSHLCNLQAPL